MSDGRRDATRRWAEGLAKGADARAAAGRTLLSLLDALEDGTQPDRERLARIRKRAREAARAEDPELRAAARLVVALAGEVASGRMSGQPSPPGRRRRPARPPLHSERRARSRGARAAVVVVIAALAVSWGAVAAARSMLAPKLDVSGPRSGTVFGANAPRATFIAHSTPDALAQQRWELDGRDVTGRARASRGKLSLAPDELGDGGHTLVIRSSAGFLGGRSVRRFAFRIDTTPPSIRVPRVAIAHAREPLTVRGTIADAVSVSVDNDPVELEHGQFQVRRTAPLPHVVRVSAVDEAGNRAMREVRIALIPRRPAVPVRAVHVTFYAWADPTLRAGIMKLIRERRINTVEIDLKDESGLIGFDADVPLGRRIGAVEEIYDLRAAVRHLHSQGIRVIGRLVCFRDPILAKASWRAGRRNEVVQTPSGAPYAGYGGFTNFATDAVRRYNIAVAVAAARAGVDDVLYDYVRRPDGPITAMRFPGIRGAPEDEIVEFLRESRLALRPYRTYVGASVFGVAATRPDEVAQPIRRMAENVDYISPMVYPSHWGAGEYNVANPNGQPYDIVLRSLRDFSRDVAGSGARIVPWLQDFTFGVTYGPTEVRAQIDAAHRDGIDEFILWDPAVTYTADALTTDARVSREELAKAHTPTSNDAPQQRATQRPTPAIRPVEGRMPNELGVVPVVMHHEIRPDRVGAYDQTPAEFRAELEQLWRQGYWPVTAAELVHRNLGSVPAGKTPVVLTFDDATRYQLTIRRGKVDPTTAVGVMLAVARERPGFRPVGTFYVLREPFGGVANGGALMRWLVRRGFELGNHTRDHLPLRGLPPSAVTRELVLGEAVITRAVPRYRVSTMSLPLGEMPEPPLLARTGRWKGRAYGPYGVFLVGANPAPSPFSTKFDPGAIPRIRSSHQPWHGERDFGAAFWLHELAQHPEQRYVSDGDAKHITFPRADSSELRPRFRRLARPY